jgi:hypothetical protein
MVSPVNIKEIGLMTIKQINSLSEVDVSRLTFSDLSVKHGTFRRISIGSLHEKKYSSRTGVQTEIGDVKLDVWQQLAELLVEQTGEGEILVRLIEYAGSLPWMRNRPQTERRQKALDLHMSRVFDNPGWVGFIPFNELWRPEILKTAEIIEIITPCCGKPGRITLQQRQTYTGEETVSCPICGRQSTFQRIGEGK